MLVGKRFYGKFKMIPSISKLLNAKAVLKIVCNLDGGQIL